MSTSTPNTIELQFRRADFDFMPTDSPWLADLTATHFFHALSLFIPVSERYVSAIILQQLDALTDETLKQQARIFIQQESRHGYLHKQCNQLLLERYPRLATFQRWQARFIKGIDRIASRAFRLGIPACFEHITANISRDFLVNTSHWTKGKTNTYIDFVQWHCLEELEHQAICLDVYRQQLANTKRISVYLLVFWLPITMISLYGVQGYLLFKDKQLQEPKQWWKLIHFIWRSHKVLRRGVLGYFKKNYTTWTQQDEDLYRKHCPQPIKKES